MTAAEMAEHAKTCAGCKQHALEHQWYDQQQLDAKIQEQMRQLIRELEERIARGEV
jgi:hypothetical protein